MHFERFGSGNVVVFMHGWGCDGSIFASIAHKLNATCYLLDFAGFGKSKNPPIEGWTVFDYVDDVVDLFKQNNLTNVTIVAHSFGCRVAMVLAALFPQLVAKMLLIAPAGLRRFSLARWCKVANYKISKKLAKYGLSKTSCQKYGSADYNNCTSALKNTFVKVVNQDLSNYAKLVKCPTVIVNGAKDIQTPLAHAKRLARLIKGSSFVQVEGDHFTFLLNTNAVVGTIKAFGV